MWSQHIVGRAPMAMDVTAGLDRQPSASDAASLQSEGAPPPLARLAKPEASWPEQLAEVDGRRTSRLPADTSAVRLRHAWEDATEAPLLDVCCVQYDLDGRRVHGGNVDRVYTRTEWQARTGEWLESAKYSERSAAYELTVWLHNVAPTVGSLFIVLSAAVPLRMIPSRALARKSIDLSAVVSAGLGQADGETLLCDGLRDTSWWHRMAIDRRASEDTALILCRLWRSGRGGVLRSQASAAGTHPRCEWVFEELTLGTFGRVGVCADHYAPIYATLDAWVSSQPLRFCAEDHPAPVVDGRLLVNETDSLVGVESSTHVGRFVMSNGDVFAGEWRGHGERHGQGSYVWAVDGSRYDGDWVCNQREALCGKMWYGNGDVYQGAWRADKRCGCGTMHFANGAVYEGEWVSDEINGEGTMIYANGDIYEGNWRKGLREGRGRLRLKQNIGPGATVDRAATLTRRSLLAILATATAEDIGGGLYDGDWVDGVREGKGVMIYADGTRYSGSWKNDKRNGRGEISYSHFHERNEVRYTGEWCDDVRQGEGQMEHAASGAVYSGRWAGRQSLALAATAWGAPQPEAYDNRQSNGRVASEALFRPLQPSITGPHQQGALELHRPRPRSPPRAGSVVDAARRSRAVANTASPSPAEPAPNRHRSPRQQKRPSPPLLHRQTQRLSGYADTRSGQSASTRSDGEDEISNLTA